MLRTKTQFQIGQQAVTAGLGLLLAMNLSVPAQAAYSLKLKDAMQRAGFEDIFDSGTTISKIGNIKYPHTTYNIYKYYHYNKESNHGRDNILIFKDNVRSYVGDFDESGDHVRISGRDLLFFDQRERKVLVRVRIGPDGKPTRHDGLSFYPATPKRR